MTTRQTRVRAALAIVTAGIALALFSSALATDAAGSGGGPDEMGVTSAPPKTVDSPPPASPEARGVHVETLETPTEGSTVTAAAGTSSARHAVASARQRFVTFNALLPWYGLTNQLMCYAAALRYGADDDRAVLFPTDARIPNVLPFYDLADAPATQRNLEGFVTIAAPTAEDRTAGYAARATATGVASEHTAAGLLAVPAALYPPTSMNKKKLFLPERTEYRVHDTRRAAAAREYLLKRVYARSRDFAFVRHHNFFMRFAWPTIPNPAAPAALLRGECGLMAAIEPQADIIEFAGAIVRRLGGAGSYVTLHLRVETDAALIRPEGSRTPSTEQFAEYLFSVAAPWARDAGAKTVYLCAGALPAAATEAVAAVNKRLAASGAGVRVAYRELVRAEAEAAGAPLPALRRFVGNQREMHAAKGGKATQDHFSSFAELLVMQGAARAAATAFSSLRFAVFARRCAASPLDTSPTRAFKPPRTADREGAGVHTVDIRADGSITAPQFFACAEATPLGWCGHRTWRG